jgi:nitrate reductase gamma subunit
MFNCILSIISIISGLATIYYLATHDDIIETSKAKRFWIWAVAAGSAWLGMAYLDGDLSTILHLFLAVPLLGILCILVTGLIVESDRLAR